MQKLRTLVAIWLLIMPPAFSQDSPGPMRDWALSPEASLQSIETLYQQPVNLIAAEPLVVDPIDVAFDDAGRMWVVEMRDYPFRTAETPSGCIKMLSDTDGDGIYDRAQVFVDKLEMPTGLALWQDGVLVTLAGELAFFRDTDGDFVADEKQQWLVGFSQDNEQLRANHPTLGPDGWWYIASGLRGGNVQIGSHFGPNLSEPIKIGSRDVRFDPTSRSLELVTGPAQFGLCFDSVGNRFFCSNRNPAVQVIFEQPTLTGNPLAGLVPSTVDVLPAGADSQVFPIVNAWTTSNLHAGQFTAACGVFVRGVEDGTEEVFVCEPTGSLVKRSKLAQGTAAMVQVAPPAGELQREWLASRDAWFRPVNITLAPNNEIVVVDMHRAVIEHPNWVPEELKQRPDERWGNEAGRILRVGDREPMEFAATIQSLSHAPLHLRTSAELVHLLSQPNQWTRSTVSRLLIERQDQSVVPHLLHQARSGQFIVGGTGIGPAHRIASLRVAVQLLQGLPKGFEEFLQPMHLDSLPPQDADSELMFMIAALRLIQSYPSDDQRVHASVLSLFELPLAAPFRERLAYSALQFETLVTLSALGGVPSRIDFVSELLHAPTAYPLVAAGSIYRSQPDRLLALIGEDLNSTSEPSNLLSDSILRETARQLASAALDQRPTGTQFMAVALRQLRSASNDASRVFCLSVLETSLARSQEKTVAYLETDFWEKVRTMLENPRSSLELRRVAALTLGYSGRSEDIASLRAMVTLAEEESLEEELLNAWALTNDPPCNDFILARLASGTPKQQQSALRLIRLSPARVALVAQALESGKLGVKQIGAAEMAKLAERAPAESKAVYAKLLQGLVNSDRSQVVSQYSPALTTPADAIKGKALFVQYCAACHRVGELGVNVGPDISDSRTKKPIELLTSILDPNRAIDNNFFRYVLLTDDDQVLDGIIVEETADAIVLNSQNGVRHVVQRSDLQKLKATGVSLMPEGLETQIDPIAMANLIAFIKEWRYMDGAIPLNPLAPVKK